MKKIPPPIVIPNNGGNHKSTEKSNHSLFKATSHYPGVSPIGSPKWNTNASGTGSFRVRSPAMGNASPTRPTAMSPRARGNSGRCSPRKQRVIGDLQTSYAEQPVPKRLSPKRTPKSKLLCSSSKQIGSVDQKLSEVVQVRNTMLGQLLSNKVMSYYGSSDRELKHKLREVATKLHGTMKERLLDALKLDQQYSAKSSSKLVGRNQLLVKLSLSYIEIGNEVFRHANSNLAAELCVVRALRLASSVYATQTLEPLALDIYFVGTHQLQAKLEVDRGHRNVATNHLQQVQNYLVKSRGMSKTGSEEHEIRELLEFENQLNLHCLMLTCGKEADWLSSASRLQKLVTRVQTPKQGTKEVKTESNTEKQYSPGLVVSNTSDMIRAHRKFLSLRLKYVITVTKYCQSMLETCFGCKSSTALGSPKRRPRKRRGITRKGVLGKRNQNYESNSRSFWKAISVPFSGDVKGSRQRSLVHALVVQRMRTTAHKMLDNMETLRETLGTTLASATSDTAQWNGAREITATLVRRSVSKNSQSQNPLWSLQHGPNWERLQIKIEDGILLWLRRDPPGSALWNLHQIPKLSGEQSASSSPKEVNSFKSLGSYKLKGEPIITRRVSNKNHVSREQREILDQLRLQLARQQIQIDKQKKEKESALAKVEGLSKELNNTITKRKKEKRKADRKASVLESKLRKQVANLAREKEQVEARLFMKVVEHQEHNIAGVVPRIKPPSLITPTPPMPLHRISAQPVSPRKSKVVKQHKQQKQSDAPDPNYLMDIVRQEAAANKEAMLDCMKSIQQQLVAEIQTTLTDRLEKVVPQLVPSQLRALIQEQITNALHHVPNSTITTSTSQKNVSQRIPRKIVAQSSIAHMVDNNSIGGESRVWLLDHDQDVFHDPQQTVAADDVLRSRMDEANEVLEHQPALELKRTMSEGSKMNNVNNVIRSSASSGCITRHTGSNSRSFKSRRRVHIPSVDDLPASSTEAALPSYSRSNSFQATVKPLELAKPSSVQLIDAPNEPAPPQQLTSVSQVESDNVNVDTVASLSDCNDDKLSVTTDDAMCNPSHSETLSPDVDHDLHPSEKECDEEEKEESKPVAPKAPSVSHRPVVSRADYSALRALAKRTSNPATPDVTDGTSTNTTSSPAEENSDGLDGRKRSFYHKDREDEEEDKRDAHHANAWRRVSVRVHINSTMSRLSRSAKRQQTAKGITSLKQVKSSKNIIEEVDDDATNGNNKEASETKPKSPNTTGDPQSSTDDKSLVKESKGSTMHMSDVVMETLCAIRLQRAFRRHRAYLLQVMLRDRLKVTHINVLKAGCTDALGSYERAGRDEHDNLFFIKESDQENVLHIIKRVVIRDPHNQDGNESVSVNDTDNDATEECWVMIRVQDGNAHALYYQEGETAIAQAYPTATGWELGNDGVQPLPVTELVHDKTPQCCWVINGAGSPHVNLVFEQAGEWEGLPNFQATSFVFNDEGELFEETIVLRRITYGMFDDFVWIIAGVQASGENKVYYVNSEMGALSHPPALGWGLGQDGLDPPPTLTNRRFSHSDLLPEKRSTVYS